MLSIHVLVLPSSKLFFCISLSGVDALNLSLGISRRILVLNFLVFHCDNHCMTGFERNQSLRENSLVCFRKSCTVYPLIFKSVQHFQVFVRIHFDKGCVIYRLVCWQPDFSIMSRPIPL